jgi:hypothetical protein
MHANTATRTMARTVNPWQMVDGFVVSQLIEVIDEQAKVMAALEKLRDDICHRDHNHNVFAVRETRLQVQKLVRALSSLENAMFYVSEKRGKEEKQ